MVCGPTAFLASRPLGCPGETAPRSLSRLLAGPSSLTASAVSRRGHPPSGRGSGAGAGAIPKSAGRFGGPGLTAVSLKAVLRNRVHWTHLFPSLNVFWRITAGGSVVHWGSVLSLFLRSAQSTLVHWSVPFPESPAGDPMVNLPFCTETGENIGTNPSFRLSGPSAGFLFLFIGYHSCHDLSIGCILFLKKFLFYSFTTRSKSCLSRPNFILTIPLAQPIIKKSKAKASLRVHRPHRRPCLFV